MSVLVAGKNGRATREKQVPRCARNDSQKNKGNGNSCSETNISGLEGVVEAEVADYLGGVAVLGVYG